ncbi:unnamed protein product, partial [Rotaria magnacalcarata]
QTSIDVNVLAEGLVIGYTSSSDGWIPLKLGGGNLSLVMYLNLQARPDNGLVNHSPTSSMPLVAYVHIANNTTVSIDIPMNDSDGDMIRCRFAKSNNILGGILVNECQDACSTIALPPSAQLISIDDTCRLNVNLTFAGTYAIAIQFEDFLENSTDILSSIPFQFILIVVDELSGTSNDCTYLPTILDIQPDSPSCDSILTVQMNIQYTFTVIAKIACLNNTKASITNFMTSSPQGMLKGDNIYPLTSTSYAINHTWIPTGDQLHQTLIFCTIAIDSQ